MLIPDGPFTSVSLTDHRKSGEELAKGLGIVSMASGMVVSWVPEPKLRAPLGTVANLLTKLAPIVPVDGG